MELHQNFYKERHNVLSPKQLNRKNRQLQEANRNKQRNDRFQDSRNISPSPTPHKSEITLQICREEKENAGTNEENPSCSRLVKFVCNTTNPVKLSRQEEFLKRYIQWKENKQKKLKEAENKKKPFVSAVNTVRQTTNSIVPRGHHKEFRPPAGLKNPAELEKAKEETKPKLKGRQSVYTVVPTPPRKINPPEEKILNKFPIARKALPTNLHKSITAPNSSKTPATTTNRLNKINKDKPSTSKSTVTSNNKLNDNNHKNKSSTSKNSATTSANNLLANNLVTAFDTTAIHPMPILRSKLKPRALKMPPPPIPPPRQKTKKLPQLCKKPEAPPTAPSSSKQSEEAGKKTRFPSKRLESAKTVKKKSPLKSGGARLANTLKAKKPLNTSKKVNAISMKLNVKNILNIDNENMVIQTPKDFTNANPFEEFVTSTKLKDQSHSSENVEDINPIESFTKRSHQNSSAKRNILNETQKDKQVETNSKKIDVLQNVGKKFNFIRYSEVNVSMEDKQDDNVENNRAKENDVEEEKIVSSGKANKIIIQESPTKGEKTPTKCGPEERPANYLSPFVSVARGKVSLKKEKEKRNSIYLINSLDNVEGATENPASDSPKYTVEVRRTLEAVRYFRKQLRDEIDRLHKLCDLWEMYKDENLEKIQNVNGEDMINVTIGQTRLLTSKKFMQFSGLIDRCESGATGINVVEYDGSEGTKPITSVDLEGFWSMLGIQIDNLDKRFDNLSRWKSNDWRDPDEVERKPKKNLTKVKKAKTTTVAKAKPNSALQQMLRNMRKNKNKNVDEDEVVVLTPSKQKSLRRSANKSTPRKSIDKNNSPRRLSIVVKDRKYFSPAATVISIPSPHGRSSMLQRKSSQDSPKLIKHVQKFNEALDKMQSIGDLRKSALINGSMNSIQMSLNPQSPLVLNNNRKTSLDSPKVIKKSSISEDFPKSALSTEIGAGTPKSPSSPAPTNGRKSILKTPGTARSRLRNVIFNEKLRVKKFNFMVTEDGDPWNANDGDEANNTLEEDLAKSNEDETQDGPQRTLNLRNRKVRLRPSCEIVIPGMSK